MRVPRIYEPQPLSAGAVLTLGEDGANHVGRVLRMQTGQELMLFNGQGGEYAAMVSQMGKRHVAVDIGEHDPLERESPLQLTIVQAISAASILAKVTRDRWCAQLHDQYPQYGFAGHKGYGTAVHMAALREHGACIHHRRSFAPVAQNLRAGS